MSKKDLEKCKTGKELLSYAERNGCEIRNGKGSHYIVQYEDRATVIPVHGNKQLGPGLLRVLIKWFISAGLGVLVLMRITKEVLVLIGKWPVV